jgi:hypothetical protein
VFRNFNTFLKGQKCSEIPIRFEVYTNFHRNLVCFRVLNLVRYAISVPFENRPTDATGQRPRWNSETGKILKSKFGKFLKMYWNF